MIYKTHFLNHKSLLLFCLILAFSCITLIMPGAATAA